MESPGHRPIFVTGASTGIGNHLARFLAARGHTVFASARRKADLEELGRIEHVIPVRLDVRDRGQVWEALETVTRHGLGLYGLVNNAGIGGLGLCATWRDEELLEIFDVNVFGPFRMTNAFLPLLVEAAGRVVHIGSQGGMISKRYYGPYTMTKHALEAYTVALAEELEPYGVRVSIVQPGGIVSNAGANAMPGILTRFRRAEAPFQEEAEAVLASLQQPPEEAQGGEESETNRKPSSPEIVAEAVAAALFSDRPRLRYLVGTRWKATGSSMPCSKSCWMKTTTRGTTTRGPNWRPCWRSTSGSARPTDPRPVEFFRIQQISIAGAYLHA